jgi:hypothetical protein
MKKIATAYIDYNDGTEWYATMSDASGLKLFGLSAFTLGRLLSVLKTDYPEASVQYSPRAWGQNVTEFEQSRRPYRRY